MAVETPVGPDGLLLATLTGTEAVSEPFRFELGLLAETGTTVEFEKLIGKAVTVRVERAGGESPRFINGIVSLLAQGPEVRAALGDATFVRYRAEVVPRLWLLGRQARSRTFQQKSVPDILRAVLAPAAPDFRLQGTYEPRDYCVQYRETDLAFASRLMEEEGIFYFFTHTAGGHTMVVADAPSAHPPTPGAADLIFDTIAGGTRPEDRVTGWEKTQELRPGKVILWDHCFEMPDKNLEAESPAQPDLAVGSVTHKLKFDANEGLELYDYPGGYAQRFDGITPGGGGQASNLQKIFQDNKRTAKIRMQQETARAVRVDGTSTCRQLTPGHQVTLARHPDADGSYVVTRVSHTASLQAAYTGGGGALPGYENTFECIPAALPYRPAVRTPRPVIAGPQTAVVVGKAGEEIETDKYGRVKVQFAWDREGKKDQDSSCWVRVATSWAGKNWGAICLPRIGQEVVVAFEEGDPDRPVVVGSVYNAEVMPPYTLPDNKTRSTLKTRSSKGGTVEDFNEIRFEDKKGEEEVYVHAEKDFNRVVENNDTLKVGFDKKDPGDQTIDVYGKRATTVETGDETLTVKQGKRLVQIDTGDDTHHVKTGNRVVNVDTGNDTHAVETGNRVVSIDMGNDTLTIKMGNQTTAVKLGSSSTEAMQKIELKVGANSIVIDQSGVTIKGLTVKVEGQVQTSVKGAMTEVSGDAMLQLKGGITMIG